MFEGDVTTVALVSGPLVLLGYLIGSIPLTFLVRRARMRRALDAGAVDTPGRPPPVGREGEAALVAGEAALALVAATLAWEAVEGVAPAAGAGLAAASRIAFLSSQVLLVWQSVALWAGFAAVVGHVAPPWSRFRGGTGIPPALALALAYAPTVFAAGVAGFLGGLWLSAGHRRTALLAGLTVALGWSWLAWVGDWNPGWGVASGPELSLWTAMAALVLAARNAFELDWDPPTG